MDDDQWRTAEAEWKNPSNWHWWHYAASRDPRIWVRKRDPRFGWTLNFAYPLSWVWLACILSLIFLMAFWLG